MISKTILHSTWYSYLLIYTSNIVSVLFAYAVNEYLKYCNQKVKATGQLGQPK